MDKESLAAVAVRVEEANPTDSALRPELSGFGNNENNGLAAEATGRGFIARRIVLVAMLIRLSTDYDRSESSPGYRDF